jgi:hypothetical protein
VGLEAYKILAVDALDRPRIEAKIIDNTRL